MCMCISERARFYFEPVVPVASSHTLRYIAADRERAPLPLLDDVAVLVEHQPGVLEELRAAAPKIDSTWARRCDRSTVKSHEQGMLEDPHVIDGPLEEHFERGTDPFRRGNCASEPRHGSSMIHTIGHSNHPIAAFLALLQRHAVTAVADVRSTPYSRFNPQFRREKLQASLAGSGIQYVFLGEELGARSQDPACYDADGRVSYARLAETELFRSGIQRLLAGIKRIAGAVPIILLEHSNGPTAGD